jgi:hypothetical protein
MKYATVEDAVASFPHPILPTVQGEEDYQIINAIQKLLQANTRAIDTHSGEGASGHLGIIVSDAVYAIIARTGENDLLLWTNPKALGRAPALFDQGTAAQLSATRNSWEETVLTFRMFNTVQQALIKQVITFFSQCAWTFILNEDMVGFANITAREMLYHLFLTYGNIAPVEYCR